MSSEIFAFPATLSSSQFLALVIVAMGVGFLTLATVVGTIVPAWASVVKHRMDNRLKEKMLDRGMSAEEIVNVLSRPSPVKRAVETACASEVVVESDGEWHSGLVLKRQDDRYYIHYVGTDMSDNEWVTADRLRFPTSAISENGSPGDCSLSLGSFHPSQWCATSKPAPVDGDL